MRGALRPVASVALAASIAALTGCGVQIFGDFDGVPYTPDSTIFAVADRHDLLVRDGAVIPVKKNLAAQRMHVVLTSARLDVTRDWRAMPADELLELKRELATSDGLLLMDVPLDAFGDGDRLKAVVRNGESSGDFTVAVAQALPPESTVEAQGLGARITVTIEPGALEVEPRSGSMNAKIEVKREREPGQDGDVATGTVTLTMSSSLFAERLTEANLSVAAPVLLCMQARGPASAASCRGEDAFAIVDETGFVP